MSQHHNPQQGPPDRGLSAEERSALRRLSFSAVHYRVSAIQTLAQSDKPELLQKVFSQLWDKAPHVRRAAAEALLSNPERIVPRIIKFLYTSDRSLNRSALRFLERLARTKGVRRELGPELLRMALSAKSVFEATLFARAFRAVNFRASSVSEHCRAALQNSKPHVRVAAVVFLLNQKRSCVVRSEKRPTGISPEEVGYLAGSETRPGVHALMLRLCVQLGAADSRGILLRELSSPRPAVALRAAVELLRRGESCEGAIVLDKKISHPEVGIRLFRRAVKAAINARRNHPELVLTLAREQSRLHEMPLKWNVIERALGAL